MDTNLNTTGLNDTNKYLSVAVVTSYGDVYNYVDSAVTSVTAKSATKDYNPDPMTLRFTADDYYTSSDKKGYTNVGKFRGEGVDYYTSSYTDYTVYIANVKDRDVFIPTPDTTTGNCSFPSNLGTDKQSVSGYDANGTLVSNMAQVYKSGNKYKCDYNGVTYTYNATYHYWNK
jgi:hypothetical protein